MPEKWNTLKTRTQIERALRAPLTLLQSTDPSKRVEGIAKLHDMGLEHDATVSYIAPHVIRSLSDPHQDVQIQAARLIARTGDYYGGHLDGSENKLIELYKKAHSEQDRNTEDEFLSALGTVGSQTAFDTLIKDFRESSANLPMVINGIANRLKEKNPDVKPGHPAFPLKFATLKVYPKTYYHLWIESLKPENKLKPDSWWQGKARELMKSEDAFNLE